MKYFTKEWWAAGEENQDCVSAYRDYIASIIDKLPPDVALLAKGHLLHDASLTRIETSLNEVQLKMSFIGWDEGFENRTQIEFCFFDVKDFNVYFSTGQEGNEYGIGDLGYYEIELLEAGFVELRILFSSSAEMQIVFRNLITQLKPVGAQRVGS